MKYILFFFLFLNGINSFGQRDLEMEIISDLIKASFTQQPNDTIFNRKGKIKKIRTFHKPQIVLVTDTDTSYRSSSPQYLKTYLKRFDSLIHNDYLSKNQIVMTIDSIRGFDGNITYLSNSELRRILDQGGWKTYRKRYGYSSLVHVSRPGINTDKNLALIYFSQNIGGLDGIGFFLILEKTNGVWVQREWALCWQG